MAVDLHRRQLGDRVGDAIAIGVHDRIRSFGACQPGGQQDQIGRRQHDNAAADQAPRPRGRGVGTPSQIRDRFGEILDGGLTDHIVLQIPTGDMTMDEARRTMDLFCADVLPDLARS